MATVPKPPTHDAPDVFRLQAMALAAQQSALTEQEIRLDERRQALDVQERQLAGLLDEKRTQWLGLQDQLAAGRDQLRRERDDLDALRTATHTAYAEATAARDRLRTLRARLIRRWKKHWSEQRRKIQDQAAELQRDVDKLLRVRDALDQFRQRFHGEAELEKRRLQDERRILAREQALLQDDRRRFNDDLANWETRFEDRSKALAWSEQKLARDREQAERYCETLRAEARGLDARVGHLRSAVLDLERRRAMAPTVALPEPPKFDLPLATTPLPPDIEAAFAARDEYQQKQQAALERQAAQLADQRLHLAELCERLAEAETGWHAKQAESAGELEDLADGLQRQDETLRDRVRAVQTDADRLRQERENLGRLRRELERGLADLSARQTAWQGERHRTMAELNGRERDAERRERALTALFRRWRDRRTAEVADLRQTLQATAEERQIWADQRDEWRRRSQSLREAMQVIAEQTLALEEARQEFVRTSDRPAAAVRRLERLRRRWEGLSKAARRDLDKRRTELAAAEATLEQARRDARQHAADLAGQERDLAGDRAEAEAQRLRFEDENRRLETERAVWREQKQHYERQLAQTRDEVERVARLLIDDGPEMLSSAA